MPGVAPSTHRRAARGSRTRVLVMLACSALLACGLAPKDASGSPQAVRSITVTPATANVMQGDSVRLSAQLRDRSGNILQGREVTWTSSSRAVAVSSSGMVRALMVGRATITARSGSVRGTSAITVTATPPVPPPVPASLGALTITVRDQNSVVVQNLSLVTGASASLSATATSAEGVSLGTVTVLWSSSNSGVASVSAQGVVRALAAGSANIVASYQGATKTIPTTVTDPALLPPPPPAGSGVVLFHSDWSTATGTSTAARLDQGKPRPWVSSYGTLGTVVAVTTEGFPTKNAYQVANAYGALYFSQSDAYIPTPDVGDSVALRMFVHEDFSCNPSLSPFECVTHGNYFDNDPVGNPNWGPQVLGLEMDLEDNRWSVGVAVTSRNQPSGNYRFYSPAGLDKGSPYRIELLYIRVSSTTYRVEARVFSGVNLNGTTPSYTSSNFTGVAAGGTLVTNTLSHGGATGDFGPEGMTGFLVGVEAAQPGTGVPYTLGGVAICTAWCGPYPIAGVEN